MTSTLGRMVTVSTVVVMASTVLSGCGLLDGSSRIQEALEYLPDDSTSVDFVDTAAIAARLDLDDLETGAPDEDIARWTETQRDEPYGSRLRNSIRIMQDAAFSEFDVEWEATATAEEGLVRVWKLDDDTDFDAIADDLEDAGYGRSEKDGAEVFEIDLAKADVRTGLFGGRYPGDLLNLALVADEHLIVSGNVEEGLDVLTDGKDSLADEGTFDDLLERAPGQHDLEYAGLSIDPDCGIGFFAAADEPLAVVRQFNTDEEATDDESSLVTYLEGSAQAGLDVDFAVRADGDAVLAEAAFEDRRATVQAWTRSEGPFVCPLAR